MTRRRRKKKKKRRRRNKRRRRKKRRKKRRKTVQTVRNCLLLDTTATPIGLSPSPTHST